MKSFCFSTLKITLATRLSSIFIWLTAFYSGEVVAWLNINSLAGSRVAGSAVLNHPFLILPGFGNDAIDYINPLQQGEEFSMRQALLSKGIENVDVVPLQRSAWLNVAKGVFLPEFWKSECTPVQLFDFYFRAVDAKVKQMNEATGKPVVLVCHSAGGWLARAILADGNWIDGITSSGSRIRSSNTGAAQQHTAMRRSSDLVAGIVTLGAPHFPPIDSSLDMTRGALAYVDRQYPGAYLKDSEGIFYITVGGTAVAGNSTAPRRSRERYAADSYMQVTGNAVNCGNEAGDGIVPLSAVHLQGATQITLPGVWHSINAPDNFWYGRADVVDRWLPQTLAAVEKRSKNRTKQSLFGI